MSLEFWLDYHSPWAYLAATRIGAIAGRHRQDLRWRPLHLPRLIEVIGGRRPLEESAAFVRWYRQDLQDWAALHGVAVRYHPDYPLRPARALRMTLFADAAGRAEALSLAMFSAYWTEGRDISDLRVLGGLAASAGLDAAAAMEAAVAPDWKAALAANTAEAVRQGVFGVPTVRWNDRLYFGNDRLEMLDRHLAAGATAAPPPGDGGSAQT